MAGSWLASLGKALARPETFEKPVSPAIADLQREAARGVIARARHYVALAVVMACALARDFGIDLAGAFDARSARHVWMKAALWALGFAALAGWGRYARGVDGARARSDIRGSDEGLAGCAGSRHLCDP
jgi:hypothetical protein